MASIMSIDFNSPAIGRRCLFEKDALIRLLIIQGIASFNFQKRVLEVTREVEHYYIDIESTGLSGADGEMKSFTNREGTLEFGRRMSSQNLWDTERHLGHALEMFGVELKYVSGPAQFTRRK